VGTAGCLELRFQAEVEVRRVDADEEVGLVVEEAPRDPAADGEISRRLRSTST
jgi:hypothetical protein